MKTLSNATGSKVVTIRRNGIGGDFHCLYCEVYKGDHQVLDSKEYKSEKRAVKWANEKLA